MPVSPHSLLRSRQREKRGVVLVLVLWIAIILALISYSVLFQVAVEASVTSTRKKYLEAEALARAGVAKAIVDLRNDMIHDHAEEATVFDAEGDVWARPEEDKTEVQLSRYSEGYFTVRVFDENGLINLNRINAANMVVLRRLMEEFGYSEEAAEIAAAAVVDWRDSDYIPVLPNAPHNDEGIAYAMIQYEDENRGRAREENVEPLVFRNEDYLTVDELLEVYGITPRLFFGPGTREAAQYEEYFGEPEGDLFQIDDDAPYTYDGETYLGLRDYFTVHGRGVININTAPFHVLAALGRAVDQDGESFADRVISNRRGNRERDINNENAYQDGTVLAADVEVAAVVNQLRALGLTVDVRSNTFRIVSTGVVGDVRCVMEVLVSREYRQLVRDETFEARDRAAERRAMNSGRLQRREDRSEGTIVRYPHVRILQVYMR
ncbi:MAG: general secretion pathway protein GspK [Candidatus Sumerlaeia bacterium]|nr:general secretion pathway protein GspK [Candidatus Sumerlaeia bacterium]